jgi:hypothetical protein
VSARRVELAIDELVLHGAANVDERALREAIERHLEARLRDAKLDGGTHRPGDAALTVPAGLDTDELGARIAAALHRHIDGGHA